MYFDLKMDQARSGGFQVILFMYDCLDSLSEETADDEKTEDELFWRFSTKL